MNTREPRRPGSAQRHNEQRFLRMIIVDLAHAGLAIAVAYVAQSMSLVSDTFRALLMSVIDVITYYIQRSVNRGNFSAFDFGTAKLEQLCQLSLGVGLVIGAIWMLLATLQTLAVGLPPKSDFAVGLALSAVVLALNVLINWYAYVNMRRAYRLFPSAIYAGQVVARRTKLLSSSVLQITITMAVVADDPLLSLWLDGLGSLCVCGVMCTNAVNVILSAARDLADAPVDDRLRGRCYEAVQSVVGRLALLDVRVRRAGDEVFVDALVDARGFQSVQELEASHQAVSRHLSFAKFNIVLLHIDRKAV
ncbi:MAG: cation transporter [Pseudomonadota bacterium]